MKKHKHVWVRKEEGGGYKCQVVGCTAEKPSQLQLLTDLAKWLIVTKLKAQSPQKLQQLQDPVIKKLGEKKNSEGDVIREYKPIHTLAFIRAYKELEQAKLISIERPLNTPFPLTDYESVFRLGGT